MLQRLRGNQKLAAMAFCAHISFVLPDEKPTPEQIAVRYLVSGNVAAILYGEPRLTHDVDFVIFLRPEDVTRLREAFPANEFYVPPPEVIHAEIARERRGHFNVIHMDTGFKADFYPAGHDEFHAWAISHMRRGETGRADDRSGGNPESRQAKFLRRAVLAPRS